MRVQDLRSALEVSSTHHVEEIPAGFNNVLLLREGRAVAGPIEQTSPADQAHVTARPPAIPGVISASCRSGVPPGQDTLGADHTWSPTPH